MEGSSSHGSQSFEMLSSKKNYPEWCEKMKHLLNLEGLLLCIEQGFKNKRPRDEMDVEALSLIRKSILPEICQKISQATTAKAAWEKLRSMFHPMENLVQSAQENANNNAYGDDGAYPLDGDKPSFKVFMTKSALAIPFQMNFSYGTYAMLPSTNIEANVTFKGKDTKIMFYGKRKQRAFGRGWRQFAEAQKLAEGDALVFEVIQSDETALHLKVQIVRCPPRPKAVEARLVVINKNEKNVEVKDDSSDDE